MRNLLNRVRSGKRNRARLQEDSRSMGRAELMHRVELLASFEQAGLGWFWATDAQGAITYLSFTALEGIGCSAADVIGQPLTDLLESDTEEGDFKSERPLKFLLGARNSITQLSVRAGCEKRHAWWEISGKPQFDEKGNFTGYRGSAKDITAKRESMLDAARMAQYDELTGLANRHRMKRRLATQIEFNRNTKRSCALLLLDLDRFKQVNDTHGHPVGDELLKQVASRLKRIVGKKGEIGRMGGDEFQILLPDEDDRGVLGDLGLRLVQMISQPYTINGLRAVIGASVGIAIAPYDGVEPDELVSAADLALYSAKSHGRGQYRFYSSELKKEAQRRAMIEGDLRDAISRDELRMYYQPIVDAETHKVKCMEALIRWEHSERGFISPGEFIPIAEEAGLIKSIGSWAIQEVCRQAVEWPEPIRVAINVSAVQFENDDFSRVVSDALKDSKIDPARVELEITESVFIGDYGRTLRTFKALKKLGVRLALDDFGTGYSSLSYLRNAPFDKIKVDQSFVRGATEKGNNNKAIISSIVSLAQALNMETVAEGVETKDELSLVKERGASHIQGMIFSPAIPHEQVMEKLGSQNLVYEPRGPEKYRAPRRSELRRIGLIHDDHRYQVILRNLSKSGALIEGLMNVPIGTKMVLDLGDGQLAVAGVVRSDEQVLGVEFETPLISNGADGLCTRHRVSPYLIEAAGRPLKPISDDAYAQMTGPVTQSRPRAFLEVAALAANGR